MRHRCFKGSRDVSLKDWTLLNIMMMLSLRTDLGSPKKKCGEISSLLPLSDDHNAGQKKVIRNDMGHAKRIWYLSPMRAAKVQSSLRIRAVSPEPSLLAHTSSESRGTFRQKARSLAPLNGWACAVEICHDGMLEDTNSLGGAHITLNFLLLEIYLNIQLCIMSSLHRLACIICS